MQRVRNHPALMAAGAVVMLGLLAAGCQKASPPGGGSPDGQTGGAVVGESYVVSVPGMH